MGANGVTKSEDTTTGGPLALHSSAGLGPLYAERDHVAQGEHYTRHLSAMTGEGLHAKSAIAAELAHRDLEIERLRAEVARLTPLTICACGTKFEPRFPGECNDCARMYGADF